MRRVIAHIGGRPIFTYVNEVEEAANDPIVKPVEDEVAEDDSIESGEE